MQLTDAQRRALRRKAAENSLEVEHLLKVAAAGDASDAAFLQAIKAEYGWSDTEVEKGERVAPLGRWVDVVCRFLQEGYDGIVRMAEESTDGADFCIGLVEEIKTAGSVSALLAIGGPVVARPAANIRLAARLANAFNLLLSFKRVPDVGASNERRVREFLHQILRLNLTDAQRASVVCALRGVGDAQSVALIAGMPPFKGSWAGLKQSAVRQIKKRLRRSQRGGG
jgi:hypothetical protein